MVLVSAKFVVCYSIAEGRRLIGWYEYQIENDVRRFVPIYNPADRVKAKQFWKLQWDAPDLLLLGAEEY